MSRRPWLVLILVLLAGAVAFPVERLSAQAPTPTAGATSPAPTPLAPLKPGAPAKPAVPAQPLTPAKPLLATPGVPAKPVIATTQPSPTAPPATGPVRLTITSPRAGESVDSNDVTVSFRLENYQLFRDPQSGAGPHVHFILDNEPYVPHYDANQPFVIRNVAEGTHVLRAFPSRPWHESIKQPEAFALVVFHVRRADNRYTIAPTDPVLTWSRPHGSYSLDAARRILFDFFVSNVTLSPMGHRVWFSVNGFEGILADWRPYVFNDVQPGTHSMAIELRDASDRPVPGPFNRSEWQFTVVASGEATTTTAAPAEVGAGLPFVMPQAQASPSPLLVRPSVSPSPVAVATRPAPTPSAPTGAGTGTALAMLGFALTVAIGVGIYLYWKR